MAKLIWKVVIVGDPAVGKTSIRRKYLGETTLKEYIYTIGADFATKRIKLSDNLYVQYQIFDLAGQQKFDKVRASFYSGAQTIILVYDITKNESLLNLPKWVKEAKRNSDGALETFVIVGNKIDLRENKTTEDKALKKFLTDLSRDMGHDIQHIYTSALTGENIDQLFMNITKFLIVNASKDSPQIARLTKGLFPKKAAKIMEENTKELSKSIKEITSDDPIERRMARIELEVAHIKAQVTELYSDIKYPKDPVLKYLHKNKQILDDLNLKTD